MEWDAFLPHVLPSVDQCPDGLALDHLVKAARTLCGRTRVWNFECDPIQSVARQGSYVVPLEDGQELVRVLGLAVGSDEYGVGTGHRARRADRAGSGKRFARMSYGTREFVLNPAPGRDGIPIVVDVAVQPTLDAAEWPDDLSEYMTDIVDGALASLLLLPKQPWTDRATSDVHHSKFMNRIEDVLADVNRGHARSARPNRSVWF